jgi:flagellar protein FlaJ
MPLNKYQKICYRLLGKRAAKSSQVEYIKRALEKSYTEIRPEAYVAYSWMNGILGALVGITITVLFLFLFPSIGILLPQKLLIIIIPLPIFIAAITYLVTLMIPESKANARKKDIRNKLPYALNFIAAMASAGVTPSIVFKSLAEQPVYGEVQKEAAWIYRDISIFNIDIVTALRTAAIRTPSIKFQEFLQGAITTVTSGGDLRTYFLAKSEEYMRENRRVQKEFLETLGVLAESYVTVVVAAPLFLIIMMSVMTMVGGGMGSSVLILYLIAFIMLPLSHLGFAVVIKSSSPEV